MSERQVFTRDRYRKSARSRMLNVVHMSDLVSKLSPSVPILGRQWNSQWSKGRKYKGLVAEGMRGR